MTHPWLAVFKALLNVNFGISALKHQIRSRERLWEPVLVAFGLLVGGGSMVFLTVMFSISLVQTGLEVGQPELVLTMANLAASAIVFVFGIAFVMSSMYFANDTAMLMSWPLRPRQIVSAKVATVLVNEYITMAVILLPIYVVYALNVPVSPWYYLTAIITFLFTPMIPLMLATLVTMLLMRVVGGTRRRDLFTMVGGILGIAVYLGIQYFLQSRMPNAVSEAEFAEMLFVQFQGLSKAIAVGYPPSLWGMQSMALAGTAAGWIALLKLVGVGAVLLTLLLGITEGIFVRAVQQGRESTKRRAGKGEISWSDGSPIDAVARIERRLLFRTPVYALNGLLGFVLLPLLLVMPVASDPQGLKGILSQFTFDPMAGALIVAAWVAFATSASSILPTSFSREGAHQLWILKSLPISGRELFLGKLRGGFSIMVVGSLPGLALLVYLLSLSAVPVVLGAVLGYLLAALIAIVGLGIDMMRPMLNWTDPARAMKSNANVMILFVGEAVVVVAAILLGGLLLRWGFSLTALVLVAIAVVALALAILWKAWVPRFEEWLARMGD